MAAPRSAGLTSLARWPSIIRSPESMDSRPAIMRSIVDLPQPEGPTKTRNSPSSTSRSTPLMTSTVPNDLRTLRRLTRPIASGSCRAQGAASGDQVAVPQRAVLGRALQRGVVDVHDAEALGIATGPL